jgi:tripartite-type tricarboxylate transporter receptor subunit TctC
LSPDLGDKLLASGADIVASSPEEFAALINAEIPKWAKLMKAAGLRAN